MTRPVTLLFTGQWADMPLAEPVDFESLIVALNDVGYAGPLSVEWEDSRMERVRGGMAG